ncbi:hypothetical protein KKC34_04985, partial [bacterium]|nr:hypothetical protein [bacterium]
MKNTVDYKSRFRILKGGKISLVVSALVVSSSLVGTSAYAVPCSPASNIIDDNTTAQVIYMCEDTSVTVTGNLNVSGSTALSVLSVYGSYTANIINEGSISSDETGVYVNTANFSLTNNASSDINVSSSNSVRGIETNSLSDSNITNSGTLNVESTDSYAYGIDTGYLYGESHILNSNTIAVDGFYGAYGISTRGLYNNASIVNDGTISVMSSDGYGLGIDVYRMGEDSIIENTQNGIIDVNASDYAVGINVGRDMYDSASILNSGLITVASLNSQAVGILVDNSMYGDTSILNSGSITVASLNNEAAGILVDRMYINASITNDSTIVVSGEDATGISVQYMGEDSSITNSLGAIIDVNGSYAALGVSYGSHWPVSMQDNATITNAGTINVNSGGFAVGIAGKYYASYDNNASITNSGTITATINGEADENGFSIISWGVDVTNTSTGKLYGNLQIDNGATLSNSGLISLPHNASAYVSNFVQTSTGTLEIGLFSDENFGEDGMSHSHLETDTASFANDSTIAVNVLTLSENQGLLVGQTLEGVVTASASLTIEGALNIADNSALLNFNYFTTDMYGEEDWAGNGEDGAIHLQVVDGQTILASSIAGDGDTNTQSAAAVL